MVAGPQVFAAMQDRANFCVRSLLVTTGGDDRDENVLVLYLVGWWPLGSNSQCQLSHHVRLFMALLMLGAKIRR